MAVALAAVSVNDIIFKLVADPCGEFAAAKVAV